MSCFERATCHDCNVREGEIHDMGCDMERCPFCGGQLITCNCCYTQLGIDCSHGTEIYQQERWLKAINAQGRIPYILWPNLCHYCGELWPKMFNVPDKEWKRWIQLDKRSEMVCHKCYKWIISLGQGQQPGQQR